MMARRCHTGGKVDYNDWDGIENDRMQSAVVDFIKSVMDCFGSACADFSLWD